MLGSTQVIAHTHSNHKSIITTNDHSSTIIDSQNVSLLSPNMRQSQQLRHYETVFVAEFMRHGARSHYQENVPRSFFDGAKPGHLTRRGRIDQLRVGQARRREYINEKKFLSERYNPSEILSIATFRERCVESGRHFLQGMYPLEDHRFTEHITHHDDSNTPIQQTMYSRILQALENMYQMCYVGPVIEIPHSVDLMMHTRNCRVLDQYLNKDKFDVQLLERMLYEQFGPLVNSTKDRLEKHFNHTITNLRTYFELIDALAAEMYQTESPELRTYQRQECFILANNFVGPEKIHSEAFVSRVLAPVLDLMENAKERKDNNLSHILKYLQVTFHDTNLSNLLRFLGYFETYGYEKFVMFSSSLRFELLRNKYAMNSDPNDNSEYYVRINFDNLDLKLPFCKEKYCTYDEFTNYLSSNLILDYNQLEKYCNGEQQQQSIAK